MHLKDPVVKQLVYNDPNKISKHFYLNHVLEILNLNNFIHALEVLKFNYQTYFEASLKIVDHNYPASHSLYFPDNKACL